MLFSVSGDNLPCLGGLSPITIGIVDISYVRTLLISAIIEIPIVDINILLTK